MLGGVERVGLVRDTSPLQDVCSREAGAYLIELRELVAVAECLRHTVLRSLDDMVDAECLTVLLMVNILYERGGHAIVYLRTTDDGAALGAVANEHNLTTVLGLVEFVGTKLLTRVQQNGVIVQNVNKLA